MKPSRQATAEFSGAATPALLFKYLRTLGLDATNDIFAENAWYFRNALVRANYNDLKNGVLDHPSKANIEGVKANIEDVKPDIESTKADIQKKLQGADGEIFNKTVSHILSVYKKCGRIEIFGRSEVETITGLKSTRASELLKLMLDTGIIRPVEGHGKGKYRFTI